MVYTVGGTLKGRLARRAAMLIRAKPLDLPTVPSVISFTFDDVYASAVDEGAQVLEQHGFRGTYYVAGSLMGRSHGTIPYFDAQHLAHLLASRHEIGCHTFDHADMAGLAPTDMEAQWDANLRFVQEHCGIESLESFAYPYGSHNLRANRVVARRFMTGRDVRFGVNRNRLDLSKLQVVSLDTGRQTIPTALQAIERTSRIGGWLIFVTHDISRSPLPYGCTPLEFRCVAEAVAASGIVVRPVREAVRALAPIRRGVLAASASSSG